MSIDTKTLTWQAVAPATEFSTDWGEVALVEGNPVAIFHTSGDFFAVGNIDPATGSPTMSRGLTGSKMVDGALVPTIAAPLHKEIYSLITGECFTNPELSLPSYDVRVVDGIVEIAL